MPARRAMPALALLLGCLGLALTAAPAPAHETELHQGAASTVTAADEAVAPATPNPFPFALGGPFRLTDHNGVERRPEDFHGSFQLIVFGYVNCENMCPLSLARLAGALDALGALGDRLQPLFITVNPEEETPAVLRQALQRVHGRILGLTGSPRQVEEALAGFRLKREIIGPDLEGDGIVSHGSYMYLMGPDGRFLTLLPPIFQGPQLAERLRPYLVAPPSS